MKAEDRLRFKNLFGENFKNWGENAPKGYCIFYLRGSRWKMTNFIIQCMSFGKNYYGDDEIEIDFWNESPKQHMMCQLIKNDSRIVCIWKIKRK